MNLLETLDQEVVVCDGAMGTLLIAQGEVLGSCLEGLNLTDAERITAIHRSYVEAGARILRTNSLGANTIRLAAHGLEARANEINWQAAQCAVQAGKGHDVLVAGSVGPLTGLDIPHAQKAQIFRAQIGALLDGGARMIFFETFQDVQELVCALECKYALHHCPAACSMVFDRNGKLPDGTDIAQVFQVLQQNDAELIGVNCMETTEILPLLQRSPTPTSLAILPSTRASPEAFAHGAMELIHCGARVLGGCCGTTPAHIAALSAHIAAAKS